MSDTDNGWTNYETRNVGEWLGNDETLYAIASALSTFADVVDRLRLLGITATPDGVSFDDAHLDDDELNALVGEL